MVTNLNSMPICTLNEQFTLGNVNLQPKDLKKTCLAIQE